MRTDLHTREGLIELTKNSRILILKSFGKVPTFQASPFFPFG